MSKARLIKLIHVGCRELRIDAEDRKALQTRLVGKSSLSDMTEAELRAVLAHVKEQGFKPKPSAKARPLPERADVRYIYVLWDKLADAGVLRNPSTSGINTFIRKRFAKKWGAVPMDVSQLTEWNQINDVIKALKDWCAREGIDTTPNAPKS